MAISKETLKRIESDFNVINKYLSELKEFAVQWEKIRGNVDAFEATELAKKMVFCISEIETILQKSQQIFAELNKTKEENQKLARQIMHDLFIELGLLQTDNFNEKQIQQLRDLMKSHSEKYGNLGNIILTEIGSIEINQKFGENYGAFRKKIFSNFLSKLNEKSFLKEMALYEDQYLRLKSSFADNKYISDSKKYKKQYIQALEDFAFSSEQQLGEYIYALNDLKDSGITDKEEILELENILPMEKKVGFFGLINYKQIVNEISDIVSIESMEEAVERHKHPAPNRKAPLRMKKIEKHDLEKFEKFNAVREISFPILQKQENLMEKYLRNFKNIIEKEYDFLNRAALDGQDKKLQNTDISHLKFIQNFLKKIQTEFHQDRVEFIAVEHLISTFSFKEKYTAKQLKKAGFSEKIMQEMHDFTERNKNVLKKYQEFEISLEKKLLTINALMEHQEFLHKIEKERIHKVMDSNTVAIQHMTSKQNKISAILTDENSIHIKSTDISVKPKPNTTSISSTLAYEENRITMKTNIHTNTKQLKKDAHHLAKTAIKENICFGKFVVAEVQWKKDDPAAKKLMLDLLDETIKKLIEKGVPAEKIRIKTPDDIASHIYSPTIPEKIFNKTAQAKEMMKKTLEGRKILYKECLEIYQHEQKNAHQKDMQHQTFKR